MKKTDSLTRYISAFIQELVHHGVTDIVISPGSRSTPIAMVMAEHPKLKLHVQVDERSAAFFALGIAKATNRPAVVLCTSGTAAANYFPAIAEAKISRVPLIILTADRPHELRDVGAPQAIDQIHLYGDHVKWFMEMALPEDSKEMIRYVRTIAARSVASSLSLPMGAVHLNFPLREPLIPNVMAEDLFEMEERPAHFVEVELGKNILTVSQYKKIADKINKAKKGLIVVGQIDQVGFSEAVTKLANYLQFPILADPLSQLRSGSHDTSLVMDSYDAILKTEEVADYLHADCIIRFGAMPVSKPYMLFSKSAISTEQIVVDGAGGWREPNMTATHMVFCDETIFCEEIIHFLEKKEESKYTNDWVLFNQLAKEQMRSVLNLSHLNESKLFAKLEDLVVENSVLFISNSMPIRDLDSFFTTNNKNIKIMANRGANGIDGVTSSALGVAVSLKKPLTYVVGDLTFFHDLNGLLTAKKYGIPINIILINNNGGGIFSFLPQSKHKRNFELLFSTPIDLNFEHVVKMYEGNYELITSWEQLDESFKKQATPSQLNVFEIRTDRELNEKEHREAWRKTAYSLLDVIKDAH